MPHVELLTIRLTSAIGSYYGQYRRPVIHHTPTILVSTVYCHIIQMLLRAIFLRVLLCYRQLLVRRFLAVIIRMDAILFYWLIITT